MSLHKDLTGADLHEPKGITGAASGNVYVADGLGSGAWASQNGNNLVVNQYWLTSRMDDLSAPASNAFFRVPVRSELFEFTAILRNAITVLDTNVTVWINGVLFPDAMIVPFSGSAAGAMTTKTITTAHTISAGSLIEVRSDGASSTTAIADIQIGLRAK